MQNQTAEQPTARIIPGNQRMNFLPRHYGRIMMVVENTTYNLANKLLNVVNKDGELAPYQGGHWEYAEGPSGAPFMFPKTDQPVEVTNPISGETYTLSAMLGGLYLSMTTLQAIFSHRVWDTLDEDRQDSLIDTYHNLRNDGFDLAQSDDEKTSFFRLTD